MASLIVNFSIKLWGNLSASNVVKRMETIVGNLVGWNKFRVDQLTQLPEWIIKNITGECCWTRDHFKFQQKLIEAPFASKQKENNCHNLILSTLKIHNYANVKTENERILSFRYEQIKRKDIVIPVISEELKFINLISQ